MNLEVASYPETYDDMLTPEFQKEIIDFMNCRTKAAQAILDNKYFENDKKRTYAYERKWEEIEDDVYALENFGIFLSYNDFHDGSWHLITEQLFDEWMDKD